MSENKKKLHWLVRFFLYAHRKLVIDRIKLDAKDITFRPATTQDRRHAKRLSKIYSTNVE